MCQGVWATAHCNGAMQWRWGPPLWNLSVTRRAGITTRIHPPNSTRFLQSRHRPAPPIHPPAAWLPTRSYYPSTPLHGAPGSQISRCTHPLCGGPDATPPAQSSNCVTDTTAISCSLVCDLARRSLLTPVIPHSFRSGTDAGTDCSRIRVYF